MADEELIPISYIKLTAGGIENDQLFMSASLPSGTISQQERKVYDNIGGNTVKRTPSHVDWSDVTLTRGVGKSKSCYDWFILVAQKGTKGNTKDVKIELMDHEKQPVQTWNLKEAFISSYQASASEAGGGGVAIETMSIHFTDAELM